MKALSIWTGVHRSASWRAHDGPTPLPAPEDGSTRRICAFLGPARKRAGEKSAAMRAMNSPPLRPGPSPPKLPRVMRAVSAPEAQCSRPDPAQPRAPHSRAGTVRGWRRAGPNLSDAATKVGGLPYIKPFVLPLPRTRPVWRQPHWTDAQEPRQPPSPPRLLAAHVGRARRMPPHSPSASSLNHKGSGCHAARTPKFKRRHF